MDAYHAIIGKRDTREYQDRPIERASLRRILQAARMAGSSKNSQPIRLIVVRDPEQKIKLGQCGNYAAHLPGSPLVIVVVRLGEGRPFDAGRTAQNLMVAAHAEGIASCPVALQHDARAREVLGLPAEATVAMAITLGYPRGGQVRGYGAPRIPMDEFVRQESW